MPVATPTKVRAPKLIRVNVQVGATRQALTKAVILNWDIPVPEPDKQREIVAEIEKQFTRLAAGVAS